MENKNLFDVIETLEELKNYFIDESIKYFKEVEEKKLLNLPVRERYQYLCYRLYRNFRSKSEAVEEALETLDLIMN